MAISGVGVPYDGSVSSRKLDQEHQKNLPHGIAGLDANGHVYISNLPISGLNYVGLWDASTNDPHIEDGVGNPGDFYRVSVAGTQDVGHGDVTYTVGDIVICDYTGTWERVEAATGVISVNGKNGIVELAASDIGILFATPTAQVGLSAVTGTSDTYMRSDAAPAIDPAIAPTWTGAHTFSKPATQTEPSMQIRSNNPQFEMSDSVSPADQKRWNMLAEPIGWTLRALNDAGTSASNAITIRRSGNTITNITLSAGGQNVLVISDTGDVLANGHEVLTEDKAGIPNGVASLGSDGKVPAGQLPPQGITADQAAEIASDTVAAKVPNVQLLPSANLQDVITVVNGLINALRA